MKKSFAKILAVVIAVTLILSAMPIALAIDEITSGTAGEGITWVLDSDGTLTISGEGQIEVDWYAPPWEEYINDIYDVDIKEGITNIPSTAFCYAENLTTVNVPASVTDMCEYSTNPFWSCYSLEEINIDADNTEYTNIDGVIFNKDQTVLCYYPPNKADSTYTIPSSVTTLGNNSFNYTQNINYLSLPDTVTTLNQDAFYNSNIKLITLSNNITVIPQSCFCGSNLESIVIPDSVEIIEESAFYSCNNLKNITIKNGVNTIEDCVFNYCDELTAIHYIGTEAQWNKITINEDNEYLNNITIHYVNNETYREGYAATCKINGHTGGIYCSDCKNYVTGETIYAPGHNFENSICTVCGSDCEHIHTDFDGICDICNKNVGVTTINIGETRSVYIEKEDGTNIIMFTAPKSGVYVLESDNSDSDIDPYVSLYDSNGNQIDDNDDDGNGLNFKLNFETIANEDYYFELSSYDADSTYNITLDTYYDFSHQPTSKEPFVEFTWSNAKYQWYTATKNKMQITSDNAEVITYDWGSSSYNSQNGWSGVQYDPEFDSTCYDFFTIPLKAGESVTVELFGDYTSGVGLWDYEQKQGPWCDLSDDSIYTITVSNDGNYTLYCNSKSGDITVKAYELKYDFNKITGQTDSTLKNPVIGTVYACEATIDGQSFMSDIFEYTYFIAHQPTSAEPFVELNEKAEDAKYQWYKIENALGEITDEDVSPFTMNGGAPASYDSQTGWTGNYTEDGTSADFFNIWLNEHETIKFETYGNVSSVTLYCPEYSSVNQTLSPDKNGVVTFTMPVSMTYTLSAECDADAKIKAYKNKDVYNIIEGETAAELKTTKNGLYVCEITFNDGTTKMSDILEINYQSGDINSDESINGKDYALLLQYINGWNVKIIEDAADVNSDGIINGKDYALLLQYINGWNVTLK